MSDQEKKRLFKIMDTWLFEQLDKFKTSSSFAPIQDFYYGLEEEVQKVAKFFILIVLVMIPILIVLFFGYRNYALSTDLDKRLNILKKINRIQAENLNIQNAASIILSSSPIDSQSVLTTRLSQSLINLSFDISKVQLSNFVADKVSDKIFKTESDIRFQNLANDQLIDLFQTLIRVEIFKIDSYEIKRNNETNLLNGYFHIIQFSPLPTNVEGQ